MIYDCDYSWSSSIVFCISKGASKISKRKQKTGCRCHNNHKARFYGRIAPFSGTDVNALKGPQTLVVRDIFAHVDLDIESTPEPRKSVFLEALFMGNKSNQQGHRTKWRIKHRGSVLYAYCIRIAMAQIICTVWYGCKMFTYGNTED